MKDREASAAEHDAQSLSARALKEVIKAAQRAQEMHAALNKQFSEQEAEKDRLLEALANATKPKAIAVKVEAEKPAEVAPPDYQLIKDQAESMKRSPCLL